VRGREWAVEEEMRRWPDGGRWIERAVGADTPAQPG